MVIIPPLKRYQLRKSFTVATARPALATLAATGIASKVHDFAVLALDILDCIIRVFIHWGFVCHGITSEGVALKHTKD